MIYSSRPSILRSEPREPGVATSIADSVDTPELDIGRSYVNTVTNSVFISLQALLGAVSEYRVSFLALEPSSLATLPVSLSFRSPF
jgi:hypothetical protein